MNSRPSSPGGVTRLQARSNQTTEYRELAFVWSLLPHRCAWSITIKIVVCEVIYKLSVEDSCTGLYPLPPSCRTYLDSAATEKRGRDEL